MAPKRKAQTESFEIPSEKVSKMRTRKMRRLDEEVQDDEDGGVALPRKNTGCSAEELKRRKPAIRNATQRSATRSQVPERQSTTTRVMAVEVGEELTEEAMWERQYERVTADIMPHEDSAAKHIVETCWVPGWLGHFDEEICPDIMSNKLLKAIAVMSYHMDLGPANRMLMESVAVRPFTKADVKEAMTRHTGRLWGDLASEAFSKREEQQ
ncbi:hypothetical protein LTR85_010076 [Meristemomyces frigidus]|nr:hypothetical protein LTR85_010076 [Meristemomyces frigidus]